MYCPGIKPVTFAALEGELVGVIVGVFGPETNVQVPEGPLPVRVTELLKHTFKSGFPLDASCTKTSISSKVVGQFTPPVTVHLNL